MRYALLNITLCLSVSVFGSIDDIQFRHLSVDDGLSRNWVQSIYQDSFGILWFGTSDGLNRYDGYTFHIYKYDVNSGDGLSGNIIGAIYEDSQQRLWVGSQEGLNYYDRMHDKFIPVPSLTFEIECFFELANGSMYIGTSAGLFLFDPSDNSAVQVLDSPYITAIEQDKFGRFWFGTYKGMWLIDTADYSYTIIDTKCNYRASPQDMVIRSLFIDSEENIWIGTNTCGLYQMSMTDEDIETIKFRHYEYISTQPGSISKGAILTIAEDNNKTLWIGIENGGLNLLDLRGNLDDPVSFHHYYHNPTDEGSISNNSIHSLYLDNQNTMWVGTFGRGLNSYNKRRQKFKHHKHIPYQKNSLNNNYVNVIYQDGDDLYLGTEEGLNILNLSTGKYTSYVHDPDNPKSLGSNAVWSIFKDSHNNMWIGTWAGGLNLFDRGKEEFTRFLYDPEDEYSIGGNSVYNLLEDSDGILWIASMGGGLNKYDYQTGRFTTYLTNYNENSISNDWVLSLLESSMGEIWIASTIAVDIYNKETEHFTNFRHNKLDSNSISYNGAIMLFEDSRQTIWLGTNAGLNYFVRSDSSFRSYFVEDGLPDNTIRAITEDSKGNLWLTTNNGISKFVNGIHLPENPEFINYDINDGLQGNEFSSRSLCVTEAGIIYIGGANGFNEFHPDSIKDVQEIPKLIFTNFLVFNKPVEIGDKGSPLQKHISLTSNITLNHKQSVFSIEYAALNYSAPEKAEYAFILEGFEKEWNFVGTQRQATYTNLDPGKYKFMVKVSTSGEFENANIYALEIDVLPPWWNSLPAKLVYVLLVVLALYFFRKYTLISVNLKNRLWLDHMHKQKDEELNRMKLQFFTNISHELRTPLTLIAGPLHRLINKGNRERELEVMKRNVSRLSTLVDQILDFRKMESDVLKLNLEEIEIIGFVHCVVSRFSDFAENKSINLIFNSNIEQITMQADADKIDKILTNLISNAIKYTPELGEVSVKIAITSDGFHNGGRLTFEVADTGKGIREGDIEKIFDRFYTSSGYEDSTIGSGIGLHLTKRLVQLHGGDISVRAAEGEGSVFNFFIPLNNSELSASVQGNIQEKIHISSAEETAVAAEIPDILQHRNTIVIVDDNPELCDYLESILSDSFNIITETQPDKGIETVLRVIPDLVISDVMMPDIDGFELCRRLKTDIRSCHIPVILLTAKTSREDHIEGLENGADDYIYKPFDESILETRVANLISQREFLRKHFIGDNLLVNTELDAREMDKNFVTNVIELVKAQFENPEFTVNSIVAELGMSRSVFYKKFAALSDISLKDILKDLRLHKAKELLQSNSLSISEIAYNSGFNDPSYFTRVFKETYQVTPKEYQKSLMAGTPE